MNFTINVQNKVAIAENPPEIICGNSDYVIDFVFDKEWEEYEVKTAVFTFKRDGQKKYIEIVFLGTQCNVPILTGIDEVSIGVYAGELQTSTPATVKTKKSILCDVSKAQEPYNNTYCQLLEILREHFPLEAIESARKATEVALKAADGVVIVEQNHKSGLTFWVGTQVEYDLLETKAENCFYIISDDTTQQYIEQTLQQHDEIITNCLKPWNVEDELVQITPIKNLAFGTIYDPSLDDDKQITEEHVYKINAKHYGKIRVNFSFDAYTVATSKPTCQFIIKCNEETISDDIFTYDEFMNNDFYYDINVKKGTNTFSITPVYIVGSTANVGNSTTNIIKIRSFKLLANYDTPFIYVYDEFVTKEE